LWIVASSYLLTFAVDDALLHNRIEIAKGLAFVAVTGGLLYLLLKGWQRSLNGAPPVQAGDIAPLKTGRLLLLFAALALIVPLIGLAIIKLHGPQIEQDAYANLQAIARLKSEQIENWLAERYGDSKSLAADEGFARRVDQFVRGQHDAQLAQSVLDRLANLRTSYGYDSILLFDTSGRPLLLVGDEADDSPDLQQLLRRALTSKQVQRGNLSRDESGHIHLEWVVPIVGAQDKSPMAAVVLRVTAQQFLFPLIKTWPTTSPSAEAALVRREGKSVLILNKLDHIKNEPMTLRLSLADPELPAAIALRAAKPGTTPGKDYLGVSVLAAYRPVAGTDWSIVTKIDRAEVLAPLQALVLWVSLIALAAIVALSAVTLLLWRQQQHLQDLALLAQKSRTDRLLQSSFNEIYLFDADSLLFLQVSDGAKQNLGYSADELSRLTPLALQPSLTRESFEQLVSPLRTGEQPSLLFETFHRRKDGTTYPVQVRLELMQAERQVFLAIIQDITQHKQLVLTLVAQETRLRTLVQTIPDLVWLKDTHGVYLGCNPVFERFFGAREADIIGKTDYDFVNKELADFFRAHDRKAMAAGKPSTNEEWLTFPDNGHRGLFETVKTPMVDQAGKLIGVLGIAREITERKAAEAKILRLSQLYAALSQCNLAIVRCASEEELFPQICRDAVQFGGMKMAWIGLIDPDTHVVQPVASFGDGAEYLQDIEISADAASPYGHGPTGSAIRENQPSWCQDFMHDPRTTPWRGRTHHVWGASASLPLLQNSAVIGALTLYAGEVDAFDEAVRNLLVQMALNISFALDNFALEATRQRAQETLRESELRYSALFENMLDGFAYCRMQYDDQDRPVDFIYLDVNKAFEQMMGLKNMEGKPISEVAPRIRELSPALFETYGRVAATGIGEIFDFDFKSQNKYLSVSVYSLSKGEFVAVFDDITERRRAEQELRIAATAFEAQEGIIVTDADKVILRVNQSFSRMTGYSAEEVIGKTPDMIKSGRHDSKFYQQMWEALTEDHYWHGEIWNRGKDGEVHPDWLTITAVTNAQGEVSNYVSAYSDLSQYKKDEAAIHSLAFYDPLTGLPNRRLLLDRLQHIFAASARHHNHGALLFIDLDNFKTLNDTKGHNIGDLLLIEVAHRLQASVREGDTVARLGGDEFVVILEELSEEPAQAAAQTETVSDKILFAISQPCSLDGYEYRSSASIGISLFRDQEVVVDELLKRADTAMYQAKSAGRNTLRFYDPAMQAALEARTALESDLRCALAEAQFRLHYQMQVDHTGHILGAEVLIRWQHPDRGLVSPLDFIPLAEETGLILPIGQWVLETACAQLKAWENDPLTSELQLAVNVSAPQFSQPDFVEQVRQTMFNHGLNSDRLKLELTESLVLDNIHDTITKMQALREVGVRFSLDDFGTGYSSLSYLTQLPVDQLKIDQSFVRNIGVKHNDSVIVQTIIGMAHNLGMEVIAEGVETQEQRAFLEHHGCALCQGYLFSRPVPIDEFEAKLKQAK
jgi:diguanylate cyclase (GGDEF)-like protein/PAS domain S-box-containing protein